MAERAVAPYLRDDVHNLLLDHQRTAERMSVLEHQMAEVLAQLHHCVERIDGFETHLPTLLNAINSSNGTARVLMREIGEAQSQIAALAEKLHELRLGGDENQHVEP